jgi:dTDP-4-amino-4,6-dideoxygalactose transaminase
MYARKRFDIGWLDLASGLWHCAVSPNRVEAQRSVEAWFAKAPSESRASSNATSSGALCSLSVRSGLDSYLAALALPRGSEVLMSALTIPDMWKVVEQHGLVPVPVDLDVKTLAPRIDSIQRAASSKTRILLVAHLFGIRIDLAPYAKLARERGWLLLEDCAQAFTGGDFKGDPLADVSMFSFGPIKTAAALAGGVLCVRDPEVLSQMRARQASQPVQSRGAYAQRILKYAALKALTNPLLYGMFANLLLASGKDIDRVIQGSVRGFAGGEFFVKIRRQPSAPLCALIARRLAASAAGCGRRVRDRMHCALALRAKIAGAVEIPGADATFHSYWVFAIQSRDPARTVASLRERGFDATSVASLSVVPAPHGREHLEPRQARQILERTVYVPVYPELPEREIDAMADILRGVARADAALASDDVQLTHLA